MKILSKDVKFLLLIFLVWRCLLVVVSVFAGQWLPLGTTDRYLGGGPTIHFLLPEVFRWANFDGEHFLSIALFGYHSLEQAFFPLYPALLSLPLLWFHGSIWMMVFIVTYWGLMVSNISFMISLIVLFQLIKEQFSVRIAKWTVILLLLFPTSFYYGALYSESLFLLLTVSSFYCYRHNKFFWAGIFGFLACLTRVFGIVLLVGYSIDWLKQRTWSVSYLWLFMIPLGLISYMLYLQLTVGDPLAFYHLQINVGPQHQRGVVLLPQVYFRYLKILLTNSWWTVSWQTICLELFSGIFFVVVPLLGWWKKVPLYYVVYALIGFILPTIQGSFSSSPRYGIVLFPTFLCLALLLSDLPRLWRWGWAGLSLILLIVETALFVQGYWVA